MDLERDLDRLRVLSTIREKGMFEYTFTPDTLTVFNLIFNAEESLPIFAEKGQIVEVKGKVGELTVKGSGENRLMNDILVLLTL